MEHFKQIYTTQAKEYHRLITPEDADSNLLPALLRVHPLAGSRILDLGSGTGRIPLLVRRLLPEMVVGLDLHRAMLREQAGQRARVGGEWQLVQADMRQLPFPKGWADVVIAGWALGHLRGWYAQDWQEQIGRVVREMHRAVRPAGRVLRLAGRGVGLRPGCDCHGLPVRKRRTGG
jgi:ubiquinone/menaquinone biosynthesis C-methylase UbiE